MRAPFVMHVRFLIPRATNGMSRPVLHLWDQKGQILALASIALVSPPASPWCGWVGNFAIIFCHTNMLASVVLATDGPYEPAGQRATDGLRPQSLGRSRRWAYTYVVDERSLLRPPMGRARHHRWKPANRSRSVPPMGHKYCCQCGLPPMGKWSGLSARSGAHTMLQAMAPTGNFVVTPSSSEIKKSEPTQHF